MKPLITTVIPVYNGSNYLAEAINSAVSQTYAPSEIIVVNDGSDDDGATESIARSYGNRIRYMRKTNGGVASALNAAILEARGDYISWLSHDDIYTPDKLERQVSTLEALPSNQRRRAIIYSDFSVFYSDVGRSCGSVRRLLDLADDSFRFWLTLESSLHGCTLLIPRPAFEECGMFNEALRYTQDYDLWFRFAARYSFVHVPSVLVHSRIHPSQDSVKRAEAVVAECNVIVASFLEALSIEEISAHGRRSVGQGYALLAASFCRRGYVEPAKRAVFLALEHASSNMERIALNIRFAKMKLIQNALILSRRLIPPQLRRGLRSVFLSGHRRRN